MKVINKFKLVTGQTRVAPIPNQPRQRQHNTKNTAVLGAFAVLCRAALLFVLFVTTALAQQLPPDQSNNQSREKPLVPRQSPPKPGTKKTGRKTVNSNKSDQIQCPIAIVYQRLGFNNSVIPNNLQPLFLRVQNTTNQTVSGTIGFRSKQNSIGTRITLQAGAKADVELPICKFTANFDYQFAQSAQLPLLFWQDEKSQQEYSLKCDVPSSLSQPTPVVLITTGVIREDTNDLDKLAEKRFPRSEHLLASLNDLILLREPRLDAQQLKVLFDWLSHGGRIHFVTEFNGKLPQYNEQFKKLIELAKSKKPFGRGQVFIHKVDRKRLKKEYFQDFLVSRDLMSDAARVGNYSVIDTIIATTLADIRLTNQINRSHVRMICLAMVLLLGPIVWFRMISVLQPKNEFSGQLARLAAQGISAQENSKPRSLGQYLFRYLAVIVILTALIVTDSLYWSRPKPAIESFRYARRSYSGFSTETWTNVLSLNHKTLTHKVKKHGIALQVNKVFRKTSTFKIGSQLELAKSINRRSMFKDWSHSDEQGPLRTLPKFQANADDVIEGLSKADFLDMKLAPNEQCESIWLCYNNKLYFGDLFSKFALFPHPRRRYGIEVSRKGLLSGRFLALHKIFREVNKLGKEDRRRGKLYRALSHVLIRREIVNNQLEVVREYLPSRGVNLFILTIRDKETQAKPTLYHYHFNLEKSQ